MKNQIIKLCSRIGRVNIDEIQELLCRIHNIGGRLGYENDEDFAAVMLEKTGDTITDMELKKELYRHAYYRAKWCAAAAVSGAEGTARSENVKRIRIKLERL
jgi:hypothetical protein